MSRSRLEQLTRGELERVDEVITEFESALRIGSPRNIESVCLLVGEEARPVVVAELIAIELESRFANGEQVSQEEYLARFPEASYVIGDVFSGYRTPNIDHEATLIGREMEHHEEQRTDREQPLVTDPQSDFILPERLGKYRVDSLIGRGGMGVCYRAFDEQLKRAVAIKVLSAGTQDTEHLVRFQAEAEAIARLEHPGIVRLYEVGRVHRQPYIVLEYVERGNLADWIDNQPKSPKIAARIAELISAAVGHAHRNNVVHRDIKPPNVLLSESTHSSEGAGESASGTEYPSQKSSRYNSRVGSETKSSDSFGSSTSNSVTEIDFQPKVTDFGLAKFTTEQDQSVTQTGMILGTPGYMPPEQASGNMQAVDHRSDIYSLGATLYAMLTGRPPFSGQSPIDVLNLVVKELPVAPRQLHPGIPQDLETICLKCLEKDPDRRYQSAESLAADLRNFLSNKPIVARPVSIIRRFGLFYQRRRALCLVSASLLSILIASTAYYIHRITDAVRLAEDAAISAMDFADEAVRHEKEVVKQKAEVERQLLMSESRMLAARSASSREENPVRSLLFGIEAINITKRASLPTQPLAFQNLIMGVASISGTPLIGHTHSIQGLTISDDGKCLRTISVDRTLRFWDLTSQPPKAQRVLEHPELVSSIADVDSSPWTATSCRDGKVRLWDKVTGEFIELDGDGIPFSRVSISPTGRWLVGGDFRGGVYRWDLGADDVARSRIKLNRFPAFRVVDLEFSADGRWLVASLATQSAISQGTALAWNMTATRPMSTRFQFYRDRIAVTDASFTSDNKWLCMGRANGDLDIWEAGIEFQRSESHSLHRSSITTVIANETSALVASADDNGGIAIWDPNSSTDIAIMQLRNPGGNVPCMAFSPNGELLVTGSRNGTFYLWDLQAYGSYRTLRGSVTQSRCVAFSPDGETIITGDNNNDVRVWKTKAAGGGESPRVLAPDCGPMSDAVFARNGVYATCCLHGQIQVFRDHSPDSPTILEPISYISARAVAPNKLAINSMGDSVAVTSKTDGGIRIWTGLGSNTESQVVLKGHRDSVSSLAFSPNDQLLVSGGVDSTIRIWNVPPVEESEALRVLRGHSGVVTGLVYHPLDESQLFSVAMDGTLRLWNLLPDSSSSDEIMLAQGVLEEGTARPGDIALSPDGKLIAIPIRGHVVFANLYDDPRLSNPTYLGGDYFTSVSFSYDGQYLAAGDAQGQVHVWQTQAKRIRETEFILDGHEDWITNVGFDPTENRLITASRDETTKVWEFEISKLLEMAKRTAGRRLTPNEYNNEYLDKLSATRLDAPQK